MTNPLLNILLQQEEQRAKIEDKVARISRESGMDVVAAEWDQATREFPRECNTLRMLVDNHGTAMSSHLNQALLIADAARPSFRVLCLKSVRAAINALLIQCDEFIASEVDKS